ncbi:hypothetical protein GQ42DRAFT_115712, partial [Ramicandelaber brevisporus]
LRPMVLPLTLVLEFGRIALENTHNNIETLGYLLGVPEIVHATGKKQIRLTHLVIPQQVGTSSTCSAVEEDQLLTFMEHKRDSDGLDQIILIGWIHTHPRQPCFMSSLDLHTHFPLQKTLPEAISIVYAPSAPDDQYGNSNKVGIFRLTDPVGLQIIEKCTDPREFHPHTNEGKVFVSADDEN